MTIRNDYQPFAAGSFTILPPDHPAAVNADRTTLIMERGAFGSGEHETTRSCLEYLAKADLTGCRTILDFGSGTGILSIAALKMQPAARSWCVDIDPNAVASARRNCRLNQIPEEQIVHLCGTLDQLAADGFDLVLANIYADILLDMAAKLVEKSRPGALLVLSGILWEDNFDVRKAYEKLGCQVLRNWMLDEFSTLILTRQSMY